MKTLISIFLTVFLCVELGYCSTFINGDISLQQIILFVFGLILFGIIVYKITGKIYDYFTNGHKWS